MSLFSWIMAGGKTVNDVFDKDGGHLAKVGGFIGGLNFTDQERAEFTAAQAKAALDYSVATLNESTERSQTRRVIAILVIQFYLLVLFLGGMLYPFAPDWSGVWLSIATHSGVIGLVSGVCIFFFGTHMLRAQKAK